MRKVLFIALVLGAVFSALAFADYTVQSVKGVVEREVSPGKWEAVSTGQSLSPGTRVKTGIGAAVVLKEGGRVVTISALKNNTVEKLAAETTASGVRIGGKASDTSGTAAARTSGGVSTASTRASDAAGDIEWSE
jgi:hypothetical protein